MKGPSKYAGFAAAFVFGVGLLIVGKTLDGIEVLGLAVPALGLAIAPTNSGKALIIAIGAMFFCSLFGYLAASNEITGKAVYHHWAVRGSRPEPVTHADSPAKFREATNLIWACSLFSALVSACFFACYRKAHAAPEEFL